MFTQFQWQGRQEFQIFSQEWSPPDPVKAIVVLVHGLGEHSSRYRPVAEFLNAHGFKVIAFDHPGHGKSNGKRGHIPSFEFSLDMIDHYIQNVKMRHPELPIFLYGHSMGGEIILYYAIARRPQISGLVATSPGFKPADPIPPLKMAFGQWMARLFPSFALDNGLDISGLSRDQNVVTAYRKDPLVHPKVSAALGLEIINSGAWMLAQQVDFSLPTLLMVGTADRMIDPSAIIQFAGQSTGNLTLQTWQGFYHELHNEPEKEEVLNFIVDWIDNQSSSDWLKD